MTARSATVRLSRTALIAVSPAVIVCVSADLFCLPERSKATASIPPPKSVCLSSSRSSAAFSSATTASASSPRVWTQLVTRRTQRSIQRIHPSLSSSLRVTRSPPGCVVQASHFRGKDNRKDSEEELPSLFRIAHYLWTLPAMRNGAKRRARFMCITLSRVRDKRDHARQPQTSWGESFTERSKIDHWPLLWTSACIRCTVRSFAPMRDQGETESARVRLQRHCKRSGVQTTELVNIQRGEPDVSQFEPPVGNILLRAAARKARHASESPWISWTLAFT